MVLSVSDIISDGDAMRWGDTVLKIANGNPDVVVADDSRMPATPHEYDCGTSQGATRYISSRDVIATLTEADEQMTLFAWISANEDKHQALCRAFHVPNGEYRHPVTAGRLKAMGVRAGVPDVLMPCVVYDCDADAEYVGLAIELKRADRSNHASDSQADWLTWLDSQHWRCVVCYGADEAIDVICEYLEIE